MKKTTLGERIAAARKAAGLSQPALADRLGWGQSRISNYERNEREPTIEDINLIAKALGVSHADLLIGDASTAVDFLQIAARLRETLSAEQSIEFIKILTSGKQ